MKGEPRPKPIARILTENPEIERVRIDADRHEVELAFNRAIPDEPVLERIDATLVHELPRPGEMLHSPKETHEKAGDETQTAVRFHHHHVGNEVIEFHREHSREDAPVVWRRFKIPNWQNRPTRAFDGPDYRVMLLLSAVCGVAGLIGHFAGGTASASWAVPLAFAVSYLAGGWFAAREVLGEMRHGKIDVHFLMLVVAVGALLVDAWAEGATLLFLFSLSGGLEQFAHYRTQKTIGSLLDSAPKRAFRRTEGQWLEVPVEEVVVGDELLVKAGELFPVDGVVLEGDTSADESALTGESVPVGKKVGDHVSGGTLNLDGQAIVRVERLPSESAIQRIVALIETAQQQKAPAQRFTDTFSRYYTWGVLALSGILFVILLARERPLAEAFYRTMTLLVVASPCALVLSIPSAILVAIASGARHGILFRGGVAVENLAGVTQFAFDKTGTLTKGNLRVARIAAHGTASEAEVLRLAASVGQFSTHPLSRAIVAEGERRGIGLEPLSDFENVAGFGMRAKSGDTTVLVGSRAFLTSRGIVLPEENADHAHVEVWVAGTAALGTIYLSDEIRPEAKGTIEHLLRAGATVTLLTGDRAAVANEIAGSLGIRDVRAGLSPADKLDCIHRWQAEGKKVAMIGDGINDAPSLTAADVALAMGARGSDAALEQADVVLMHDKVENVAHAVELSRRARSIIRQNLVISLGVVVILVISALFNKIGLSLGVVGHEGSTVVVVLNGLRLLHFRRHV